MGILPDVEVKESAAAGLTGLFVLVGRLILREVEAGLGWLSLAGL